MQLKKIAPWLIALVIIGSIFIFKIRSADMTQLASNSTQVTGPAVILFRGDNSPSCRAIHQLVDEAEQRYKQKITFKQFDWSADNPLIEQYQVRFLPTVLLIDQQGKVVDRIIGESPAVQAKQKKRLTQLSPLLTP